MNIPEKYTVAYESDHGMVQFVTAAEEVERLVGIIRDGKRVLGITPNIVVSPYYGERTPCPTK